MPATRTLPTRDDPAGLDQLDAHDGVLVEEAPGGREVGADASNHRCQVDHGIGTEVLEHPVDRCALTQVVVTAPDGYGTGSMRGEFLAHVAAEEASSPGDQDRLAFDVHWQVSISA